MEPIITQNGEREVIDKLILEFFESTESAQKNELIYYLSFMLNDFPDLELVEEELKKLESEDIIIIQGEEITLASGINLGGSDSYRLGKWNYQIITDIVLPQNRMLNYSKIHEKIGTLNSLRNFQNKFMHIKENKLSNLNKLRIEIGGSEWDGTIVLENNQLEIETVWKINEFESEWEEYIKTKNLNGALFEIYLAMPAASNALTLYFAMKSVIMDIHPDCKFKIIAAESIRSKETSFV